MGRGGEGTRKRRGTEPAAETHPSRPGRGDDDINKPSLAALCWLLRFDGGVQAGERGSPRGDLEITAQHQQVPATVLSYPGIRCILLVTGVQNCLPRAGIGKRRRRLSGLAYEQRWSFLACLGLPGSFVFQAHLRGTGSSGPNAAVIEIRIPPLIAITIKVSNKPKQGERVYRCLF